MSASAPQRIWISGGRGRLAAVIARHFRAEGRPVTLFSRRPDADHRDVNDWLRPGELAGAGVLLHLAWSSLPATSEAQPGIEDRHDLPLLAAVLDRLMALPADRRPHLVFFSSGGTIYGNAPGRPSVETDPPAPLGRYGQAKAAAERLIEAGRSAGLAATILRIANPYGYALPSDRPQGIIPHAIRCAVRGEPLALWGDGSARKDYLHHEDFLAALAAVVDRRLDGCFNVSSGTSHAVREVLAEVEAQTGRRIRLEPRPAPPWDVHDCRLDNARLVAATGWRPAIALADGIRREVAVSLPP